MEWESKDSMNYTWWSCLQDKTRDCGNGSAPKPDHQSTIPKPQMMKELTPDSFPLTSTCVPLTYVHTEANKCSKPKQRK